jgi:steroid 5-alpha reductase family enzyme
LALKITAGGFVPLVDAGLVADTPYREIVRKNIPAIAFHVLNWTFIAFIQSILLFLISSPVYVLLLATQFEPDITSADIAFVSLELGLVCIEYFADQQQWGMFT